MGTMQYVKGHMLSCTTIGQSITLRSCTSSMTSWVLETLQKRTFYGRITLRNRTKTRVKEGQKTDTKQTIERSWIHFRSNIYRANNGHVV